MEEFYLPHNDSYCFIEQKSIDFLAYHFFSHLIENNINLSEKSKASFEVLKNKGQLILFKEFNYTNYHKFMINVLIYKKKLVKNKESLNQIHSFSDISNGIKQVQELEAHCDIIIEELKKHKKDFSSLKVQDCLAFTTIQQVYQYNQYELKSSSKANLEFDEISESFYFDIYAFNTILKNPFKSIVKNWTDIVDDNLTFKKIEPFKQDIQPDYEYYVIYGENTKKQTGFWAEESTKDRYKGNATLFSLNQAKLFHSEKQAKLYAKNTSSLNHYAIVKINVKNSVDSILEVVGKPNTQDLDLFTAKEEKQFLEHQAEKLNPQTLLEAKPSDLAYALTQLCQDDDELKKVLEKYMNTSPSHTKNKMKI